MAGTPQSGRLSIDGSTSSTATFKKVFYLTDLVLENPSGRAGALQVRQGNLVVISLRLENFRDLDYHWVTPIVVPAGQNLQLALTCTGISNSQCDPSVLYSGFLAP